MKLIVNASMDFFLYFRFHQNIQIIEKFLSLSDTDSYNNNIDYEYSIM